MPKPRTGRVTLRHVAEELGVSVKTVSNAFGRPDQLSPDLRERILDTAARLGYPGPDPLAAGLRRGRVGALGVAYANGLSYAFEDPVSVALLGGLTSVAEPAGAGLLLIPGSATADGGAAAVRSAVVDGLVACSLSDDDPVLHAALGLGLPLVVLDQPGPALLARHAAGRATQGAPAPWIGIEDRSAARAAAEHLLARGHRHLGVVAFGLHRAPVRGLADAAVQERASYAVSRDRLLGYRDAVTAAGLDWSAVPVAQGTDSTPLEGAAGAATVLATEPRPTALLCLSDRLAEGAAQAAADLGLRVPQDLSLVGFDDAGAAAALDLTTVRQPHRRKGELAAATLLELLDGGRPPAVRTLPTELVVRGSTAAPKRPRCRTKDPLEVRLGTVSGR